MSKKLLSLFLALGMLLAASSIPVMAAKISTTTFEDNFSDFVTESTDAYHMTFEEAMGVVKEGKWSSSWNYITEKSNDRIWTVVKPKNGTFAYFNPNNTNIGGPAIQLYNNLYSSTYTDVYPRFYANGNYSKNRTEPIKSVSFRMSIEQNGNAGIRLFASGDQSQTQPFIIIGYNATNKKPFMELWKDNSKKLSDSGSTATAYVPSSHKYADITVEINGNTISYTFDQVTNDGVHQTWSGSKTDALIGELNNSGKKAVSLCYMSTYDVYEEITVGSSTLKVPTTATKGCAFSNFKMTYYTGDEANYEIADNKVYFRCKPSSFSSEADETISVLCAKYDGMNKLDNIEIKELDTTVTSITELEFNKNTAGGETKLFIWESLTTLVPLVSPIDVK